MKISGARRQELVADVVVKCGLPPNDVQVNPFVDMFGHEQISLLVPQGEGQGVSKRIGGMIGIEEVPVVVDERRFPRG